MVRRRWKVLIVVGLIAVTGIGHLCQIYSRDPLESLRPWMDTDYVFLHAEDAPSRLRYIVRPIVLTRGVDNKQVTARLDSCLSAGDGWKRNRPNPVTETWYRGGVRDDPSESVSLFDRNLFPGMPEVQLLYIRKISSEEYFVLNLLKRP